MPGYLNLSAATIFVFISFFLTYLTNSSFSIWIGCGLDEIIEFIKRFLLAAHQAFLQIIPYERSNI